MLLGCPFRDACEMVGHDKATQTHELWAVLRAGGLLTSDRLVRGPPPAGVIALVRVSMYDVDGRRQSYWHWCVWDRGELLDPMNHGAPPHPVPHRGRITSFMLIEEPEET